MGWRSSTRTAAVQEYGYESGNIKNIEGALPSYRTVRDRAFRPGWIEFQHFF
jgi:hypothetical protein